MACCYIIFSPSLKKFYTGITQDDLNSRILKHNQHQYGAHRFTAKASDWELFLKINTESYAHARRIELRIKKMKSSKFILNLNDDLTELKKLIQDTK